MRLIFIFGLPATGKLTVATELAALTGYKLFHNHLAVNLLLSVFDFGTAPFVALREEIWLSIFEQACRSRLPGLIFTFAPESTVPTGFVERVVKTMERGGGQVAFVELTCSVDELKARMASPSRQRFQKLTSVSLFEELHAQGMLDASYMPAPAVSVDTGRCSPVEAATEIARSLGLERAIVGSPAVRSPASGTE